MDLHLAALNHRLGVLRVGRAQVQVVCAVVHVKGDQTVAQRLPGAASRPRVELSVAEEDVREPSELRISSASVKVEGPVLARGNSVSRVAEGSVGLLVPVNLREHVGHAVRLHGHGHVLAGQDVPTAHI